MDRREMERMGVDRKGFILSTTEKYPFDFDALDKGDVIPAERIEEITGHKRQEAAYAIKLMALQSQVQTELIQRGRDVVVRCDKGALRILTDPEAVDYTAKLFQQRKRQLVRAHGYGMRVSVGNLDDEQRLSHERNIVVQGAQLAAMHDARRTALKAVQRKTPGISDTNGGK